MVYAGWSVRSAILQLTLLTLVMRPDAWAIVKLPIQRADTAVIAAGPPARAGVAQLRTVLVLGAEDGPPEYALSSIRGYAADRDHSLLVVSGTGSAIQVRQYDANGRFIRNIGRSGQGPGEYQAVTGLGFHADGRILVLTRGAAGLHVYDAKGAYITSWGRGQLGASAGPVWPAPDGMTYVGVPDPAAPPDAEIPLNIVAFNSRGDLVGRIPAPRSPLTPAMLRATQGNRVLSALPIPFAPTWNTAFSNLGGFVSGRSDRYAIDVHTRPFAIRANSTAPPVPVISIRRAVAPLTATAAERREWRDSITAWMGRMQAGWRWSGPDIPNTRPFYFTIRTSLDGRIWVWVPEPGVPMGTAAVMRGPRLWEIFEPDGRYVGQLRADYQFRPDMFHGDIGWWSSVSPDGAPQMLKLRMVWP